jgi:glycosyltransferase involved in cell wall biosynthesis
MTMVTIRKAQRSIGVVVPTVSDSGELISWNLIKVLSAFADNVYFIAGNATPKDNGKVHIYGVDYKKGATILAEIANQICLQLGISYYLAKLARNVDLWIFFLGAEGLLLPVLTAKLLGGKVVLALTGYVEKEGAIAKNILYKPLVLFKRINCVLSNRIIVYSQGLIEKWNLGKHRDKIAIAHEHFLDFNTFKIKKKLDERENVVGYIGRLSEEKGILNFVEAIPKVLRARDDIEFLIGGDGRLRAKIEEYLSSRKLNDKVTLLGRISHQDLPDYLNELKLLVLPSYTEGLPNIVLEAMACGTPILATPVGAIPDIIKDGDTGFILESNSAEIIARDAMRALNQSNLDEIAQNACALVRMEYTYEATTERYRSTLASLTS